MCTRFSQSAEISKLAEKLQVNQWTSSLIRSRYNVAPSQPVIVFFQNRQQVSFDLMRWGLIPSWADPLKASPMFNARAETLAVKPSFRGPFKNSRCLIAADGFYEWRKEGKQKMPSFIRLKSKEPFTFAGLWSHWIGRDGSEIRSCAIITTEANDLIAPLHNRMPAILSGGERSAWLNCKNYDAPELLSLLKPHNSSAMELYPVSPAVNSSAYDREECILPLN